MKTVKSKDELPEWFSIEKYSELNQLTDAQLLNEISHRAEVHTCLNLDETKKAIAYFNNITKKPVNPDRPCVYFNSSLVKELNAHDIFQIKKFLDLRSPEAIEMTALNGPSNIHPEIYKHSIFTVDPHAYIKITLDAKKSEIIKDFESFLDDFFKKHNMQEPLKTELIDTTLNKIKELKVIPYLDLKLWAELSDKTIKPSLLANTLFPDGSRGDRDIRRTTEKYSAKALSLNFLDSAASQVRRKS